MSRVTIAVPQFRPRKGALKANLDRIAELLAESVTLDPRPQVVVFAETVLSGYFVEGGVREMAMTVGDLAEALEARFRAKVTDGAPIDVIIGFYETLDGTLHNSAACISLHPDGPARVVHVHRKNFLPTYARSTPRGDARPCSSARTRGIRSRGRSPRSMARRRSSCSPPHPRAAPPPATTGCRGRGVWRGGSG
jgi:predicted amidohydrolase